MQKARPTAPVSGARRAALVAALAALVATGCGSSDPVAELRDLQDQGRFEESVAPAQALLEPRPADPEVQYRYGMALARSGQMSRALFALRRAMESPEWQVLAGLELGRAELATDNPEGAVAAANRVLEAEPDHLDGLLLRSRALATQRNSYQAGLADADRALELDPGNVDAMMMRVVNLLGLVRPEDAEAQLTELESAARDSGVDSSVSFVCAMRAVLAKENDQIEEAERRFDACLEATPADSAVIEEAVKFFDENRKPERVVELLQKAVAEAPASGGLRRALAERLRAAGDNEGAEKVLREGTEIANPSVAGNMWVALADHYHALEDHAAAADALGRAVEMMGAQVDPQMKFDYADALVMAGRYDEALAIARQLPVPAQRAIVEGRVALEQGRSAEALERFTAGLELWPDNAVARYYAAVAAEGVGDFDRAVAEYRYSVRAGVTATDARLRLALLNEAMGRYSQGLEVARHDVDRNPAGLETDLVAMRLAARLGEETPVRNLLASYARRPEFGRMVAAAGEGVRSRSGPAGALVLIRAVRNLDLTEPRNAPALRVLAESLAATGKGAEALVVVDAALAKHPDAAAFYEIRGATLAATGAPAAATRAAYERAIALDAERSALALAGMARLAAAEGQVDAAVDFYARAAAADREDAVVLRDAAELLIAQGRREEAEVRLGEALARNPYDGRSAGLLADLLLERNGDLDRALALARSAERFGAGRGAEAVLARVYERRGETELAKAAAARAAGQRPGAAPAPVNPEAAAEASLPEER